MTLYLLHILGFLLTATVWAQIGGNLSAPPGGGGGAISFPAPGSGQMWASICIALFCLDPYAAPFLFANAAFVFVISLVTGVAVCVLIWAGIKMMSSQGSDEAITQAKQMAFYAIGAIILSGLSTAVILIVKNLIVSGTN